MNHEYEDLATDSTITHNILSAVTSGGKNDIGALIADIGSEA